MKSIINIELDKRKYQLVTSTVKWNSKLNSMVYYAYEPKVDVNERAAIWQIKDVLSKNKDVIENINQLYGMYKLVKRDLKISIPTASDAKVLYYIYRDLFGYSKLESLLWDTDIKQIWFYKIGFPVIAFHKTYGIIPTNIIIATPNELSQVGLLLKERCISKKEDNFLFIGKNKIGTTIVLDKSTGAFLIRKKVKEHYNPAAVAMNMGLLNTETFSFIGFFLKNKCSVLVISPKVCETPTFLSALCLALNNSKVLTIERKPELQIQSEMWIPHLLYNYKELNEKLKRYNPEYIITNDITGQLLNKIVCNPTKNYACIVSVEGSSIEEGVKKLSLTPSSLINFDLIVLLTAEKKGLRILHRIKEVKEIIDYNPEENKLKLNTVFKWDKLTDKVMPFKSVLLGKIEKKTGKMPKVLIEELKQLIKLSKSFA